MSATRLVFWRHGESEYNRSRRIQGMIDAPLSPLGVAQAQEAAARLVAHAPVRLFSSDLARAHDTAAALAALLGGEVRTDERFRERFLGGWEDRLYAEVLEEHPDMIELLRGSRANDGVPDDGEHPETVAARVLAGLADALEATSSDETLVITAHGLAILYAVRELLGEDASATLDPLKNAHWTMLERDDADAPWRLVSHN